VRELANAIQKALIFNRGGPIVREDVSQAASGSPPRQDEGGEAVVKDALAQWIRRELSAGETADAFEALMDRFGALVIREALEMTQGNRTRAAKLLGLSRPTLLSRIEKYGLTIEASVSSRK